MREKTTAKRFHAWLAWKMILLVCGAASKADLDQNIVQMQIHNLQTELLFDVALKTSPEASEPRSNSALCFFRVYFVSLCREMSDKLDECQMGKFSINMKRKTWKKRRKGNHTRAIDAIKEQSSLSDFKFIFLSATGSLPSSFTRSNLWNHDAIKCRKMANKKS